MLNTSVRKARMSYIYLYVNLSVDFKVKFILLMKVFICQAVKTNM